MRAVLTMTFAAAVMLTLGGDSSPQDKTEEKKRELPSVPPNGLPPQLESQLPPPPPPNSGPPVWAPPIESSPKIQKKFVKSKQLTLTYDLKGVGRSGVSAVALWHCDYDSPVIADVVQVEFKNGHLFRQVQQTKYAWNKLKEFQNIGQVDKGGLQLSFDVQKEGTHGITLVARNGVGIAGAPPAPTDLPQVLVVVDLTSPLVTIKKTDVGTAHRLLTIEWSATDKNIAPKSVQLLFAERKEGPWQSLARNLENSGVFTKFLPGEMPAQFFVKIEATDLAGNIGFAVSKEAIKADLSVPTPVIIDVQPSVKATKE